MHLVAESGSTKTDWRITGNSAFEAYTAGLNPMTRTHERLVADITSQVELNRIGPAVTLLDFYGAGCSRSEGSEKMLHALKEVFPRAKIRVHSDLMAAAHALFGDNPGLVCILGTGSNAAWYDGKQLISEVPSLGYILGDDGGGMGIGRAILRDYLYGNANWTQLIASQELETEKERIIQDIYSEERPNARIAQYARVALQNQDHPLCRNVLDREIKRFFEHFVLPYLTQGNEIGFVGSVAHHAQNLLQEECRNRDLRLKKIVKQPIYDLVRHLETK